MMFQSSKRYATDRYIPKVCYIVRSALLFGLYARNEIEVEKLKPQNEHTIANIYFLYRSAATLFHLVSGQEIKDQSVTNALMKLIEGSVVHLEYGNRFLYSTFAANKVTDKNFKGDSKFIVCEQNTSSVSHILTVETETLLLPREPIEANMDVYTNVFHEEISFLEREFADYLDNLKDIQFKFNVNDNESHLINKGEDIRASFTTIGNSMQHQLFYNFESTTKTIIQMGYFNKDEFDSFHTKKEKGKVIHWATKTTKGKFANGTFDPIRKLYYRDVMLPLKVTEKQKKRKRITEQKSKLKITLQEFSSKSQISDNPKDKSDSESNSNANEMDAKIDETNTYEQYQDLNTPESQGRLISVYNSIDQDKSERCLTATSEVVQSEVDYSLLNPNLDEEELNQEFKSILESRVESIINEKEINKKLLKEYIFKQSTFNKKSDYLNLYIDLYKELHQRKKEELSKTMNNRKNEVRNEKGIVVSLSQKGNIDKELDKFSHQLKYALHQIGISQIESYFEILFEKERDVLEQIIKGTRYIQSEDIDKWTLLKDQLATPYWRNESLSYFKLASRLYKDEFHTVKDDGPSQVYERLIKCFEDKMPYDLRQLLKVTEDSDDMTETSENMKTPNACLLHSPSQSSTLSSNPYWPGNNQMELRNPSNRKSMYSNLSFMSTNQSKRPKRPRTQLDDNPTKKNITNDVRVNLMNDTTPNRDISTSKRTAYTQIIDIVETIFQVNGSWRLKKSQTTVDSIFDWLKERIISKREWMNVLATNYLWEFPIDTGTTIDRMEDMGLEFIRAHYTILSNIVLHECAEISNQHLAQKAYDDAILLEESQPSNKLIKSYKEKIINVYNKYCNDENHIDVLFDAEEFTFPFLWRYLKDLQNLKLLDQNSIKKVVIDSEIQCEPFCLTDLLGKDSCCLVLTSVGVKVHNLKIDDIYDKFHQTSKIISNILCNSNLHQIMQANEISGDDFDFMATMFFEYESNRQTELDKSNFISSNRSTSSRSKSSTSSLISKGTVEAFKEDLIRVFEDSKSKNVIVEMFNKHFKISKFKFIRHIHINHNHNHSQHIIATTVEGPIMIHNLLPISQDRRQPTSTANLGLSVVIDSIEAVAYHQDRIKAEVTTTPFDCIQPLKDVLFKAEKETLDSKITVALSDESQSIEALYIILALFTPISQKSEDYQFLQERSTDDCPLAGIRKEYLNFLKLLFSACFKPREKHVLPILNIPQTLSGFDKMRIESACYKALGKSICDVLFCGVQQVIYNGSIYRVVTPNDVVKTIKNVFKNQKEYRKKRAKFDAMSPEEKQAYKKSKEDKNSSPAEFVNNKTSETLRLRTELTDKRLNQETHIKIQTLQNSAPMLVRSNIHLV